MRVDEDRLREDLSRNGSFGRVDEAQGHGRTVLTGSTADEAARDYFVERLRDAGLTVRVDDIGNIAGRWIPSCSDPDRPAVAAGSHLDSVPCGGIFDGPLGVYGALEAVRAMQEADLRLERPVEVVSFTEEEGQRFGVGLLGSAVAGNHVSASDHLDLTDETGRSLREYLDDIGYLGDSRLNAAEWTAWFELHIEQGSVLERNEVSAGIVTAIPGITNCNVCIEGEANHAGATRMGERRDALVAAACFVRAVERIASEVVATESEYAVATVGEIDVEPNARNVVPGRAELSIDARDVDGTVLDDLVETLRERLEQLEDERGVETTLDRYHTDAPTWMSDRCRSALAEAAGQMGIETMSFPSGGGHDTMKLADSTDVGMLFAPSRDGISHSPREWTDWVDCRRSTEVLANAIATTAGVAGEDT